MGLAFIFTVKMGNSAGDIYVGHHSNSIFKGLGTYIWNDGRIDIGMFDDNRLNGYAIATYPDATVESVNGKMMNGRIPLALTAGGSSSPDLSESDENSVQSPLPDAGDDLQFAASGSGFAVSTRGASGNQFPRHRGMRRSHPA